MDISQLSLQRRWCLPSLFSDTQVSADLHIYLSSISVTLSTIYKVSTYLQPQICLTPYLSREYQSTALPGLGKESCAMCHCTAVSGLQPRHEGHMRQCDNHSDICPYVQRTTYSYYDKLIRKEWLWWKTIIYLMCIISHLFPFKEIKLTIDASKTENQSEDASLKEESTSDWCVCSAVSGGWCLYYLEWCAVRRLSSIYGIYSIYPVSTVDIYWRCWSRVS